MRSIKTYSFLLLILPLLIASSPITAARRVPKGGCLNYGHSCLGAHGKRSGQSSTTHPLLSVLLDALNSRPEALAILSHSRVESPLQGADVYHQGVRYSNRRNVNYPRPQDDAESQRAGAASAIPSGSESFVNLFNSRGRDVRTRGDDDMGGDEREGPFYLANVEDYVDDRFRRSVEENDDNAATTENTQKEISNVREQDMESRNHQKVQKDSPSLRDNTNHRYPGKWERR